MKPGQLRDMVDIQQDASADGDPSPDYTGTALYEDVPCNIQIVGGDETYRGRQLEAKTAAVVELHYMTGVLPNMRLYVTGGFLSGRTFNITNVRPKDLGPGKPKMLELYCREVQSL